MQKFKEFPNAFKDRCLKIAPNVKGLKENLDKGDLSVGRILDVDIAITPNLIVSSFESSMSEEEINNLPEPLVGLYKRAKQQEELDFLLGWFLELVSE